MWTTQTDPHLVKCSNCTEEQVSQAELIKEVVTDLPRGSKTASDHRVAALTHTKAATASPEELQDGFSLTFLIQSLV